MTTRDNGYARHWAYPGLHEYGPGKHEGGAPAEVSILIYEASQYCDEESSADDGGGWCGLLSPLSLREMLKGETGRRLVSEYGHANLASLRGFVLLHFPETLHVVCGETSTGFFWWDTFENADAAEGAYREIESDYLGDEESDDESDGDEDSDEDEDVA